MEIWQCHCIDGWNWELKCESHESTDWDCVPYPNEVKWLQATNGCVMAMGTFALNKRRAIYTHTNTHTRLTALFPGLPGSASTRKVKPIWILLKQETMSGSGVSWVICRSAPCSRQTTTPAPHHSVFYRLDALPAAQPTASKHWRDQYARRAI